jgi:hypothetical protein
LSFVLLGAAAGPVDVQLYDLRGRIVASQRIAATGSGNDAAELDLAGVAGVGSGIYFLRATTQSGPRSKAVRMIVLR